MTAKVHEECDLICESKGDCDMEFAELIERKVHNYYWNDDLNCAITSLLTLSEIMNIQLCPQIMNAAIGIPGSGRCGAQCGLVSGALMFIGILGKEKDIVSKDIVNICHEFTTRFVQEFGRLNCSELRPQGFKPDNPPHLCEAITKRAVAFTLNYLHTIDTIGVKL